MRASRGSHSIRTAIVAAAALWMFAAGGGGYRAGSAPSRGLGLPFGLAGGHRANLDRPRVLDQSPAGLAGQERPPGVPARAADRNVHLLTRRSAPGRGPSACRSGRG